MGRGGAIPQPQPAAPFSPHPWLEQPHAGAPCKAGASALPPPAAARHGRPPAPDRASGTTAECLLPFRGRCPCWCMCRVSAGRVHTPLIERQTTRLVRRQNARALSVLAFRISPMTRRCRRAGGRRRDPGHRSLPATARKPVSRSPPAVSSTGVPVPAGEKEDDDEDRNDWPWSDGGKHGAPLPGGGHQVIAFNRHPENAAPLTAALQRSPDLAEFVGRVSDSGEVAGPSRPRSTRAYRRPSPPPPSASGSLPGVRRTSPTGSCQRCAWGSEATRRSVNE